MLLSRQGEWDGIAFVAGSSRCSSVMFPKAFKTYGVAAVKIETGDLPAIWPCKHLTDRPRVKLVLRAASLLADDQPFMQDRVQWVLLQRLDALVEWPSVRFINALPCHFVLLGPWSPGAHQPDIRAALTGLRERETTTCPFSQHCKPMHCS